MAATKTSATLQASVSNAAAATKNSSDLDLSTAYGAVITAKITNGATGPTIACQAIVQVSPDGTTYYNAMTGTAPTTASAVATFYFEIPLGVMHVRVQFTGNTVQAVTVEAQAQYCTGI